MICNIQNVANCNDRFSHFFHLKFQSVFQINPNR